MYTVLDNRMSTPRPVRKSGETSEVRHDAAYVELPNGKKFIIVILTRAGDLEPLVPAIGKQMLKELSP